MTRDTHPVFEPHRRSGTDVDRRDAPHTVVTAWRFGDGAPRLESGESLEGHPWLRVVSVQPRREDASWIQILGALVAPLKDIARLFEPGGFMPKVDVVRIVEPEGEPLVFEGSGAVQQGEAITALLCEPDAEHGHVLHEPRHDLAGLDVLLVVHRGGAPDDLWRAGVDHILASGATRVRVLFADGARPSHGW